jgi:gamma-glutamyl-gamma-aminobutyrate hydrolase PuuD
MTDSPSIVITVADPSNHRNPETVRRKNDLYAAALARHGADPVLVDASMDPAARASLFSSMQGLVLAGGADVDPARYGRPNDGSRGVEPERDELEAEAWALAADRDLPVLGICRGIQAMNVFMGGTLLQDVHGHAGPGWGEGPALRHPLRLVSGTRLARILVPTNVGGGVLSVNSYHHQAIRRADLAPGLRASAWATSVEGDLVEAAESSADGRLLIGLQCHPERSESTPPAFDRLWRVFVDACRGPASGREAPAGARGSANR